MPLLDEKTLILDLKKGNIPAFERIFSLYHKRIYNFCLHRVLSGQRNPQLTIDHGVELVVSAIRDELLPLAYELNIILAMENHYKDGMWLYPEFAQKKRYLSKS